MSRTSHGDMARRMFPPDAIDQIAEKYGVTREVAKELHELKTRGRAETQPTETQAQEWLDESLRQVRERFGVKTDEVLAKAQAMVAQDPDLAKVLELTRYGSRSRIVVPLAVSAAAQLEQEAKAKVKP